MNLEQTLTAELATVARGVDAPPPLAVAQLVRQAERARRRHVLRLVVGSGLVAAAVLAGIALAARVDAPDRAPSPTRPSRSAERDALPVGKPLRTYVDPATEALYLDGVPVQGSGWIGAETTGDVTLGHLGAPDTGYVGVFLGAERVGTVHPVDGQVRVAPGLRTIAWAESKSATGALVVARLSTEGLHELGRLPLATLVADDEGHEDLLAVADDGTVTYGGVTGGHTWKPGGSPRPADISSYLYGPAGFPGGAEDVRLDPSGSWGAWLTDPRDPGVGGGEASWRAVTFQQPDKPETRTRITMPARDDDVRSLYWESPTDLVLEIHTGNPLVHEVLEHVRCNVVDRACELAPGDH